ncbi:hypothetical protein B296_00048402 [Ensete ventricosum]|uniref:Uncharacterized protein n=1 Tax=Ensete ventricosum TaxID=4639 RepID=A0A426XM89_ENSVE|nr:hypothetical protein B296_00048402 [Ensete ventricosum]
MAVRLVRGNERHTWLQVCPVAFSSFVRMSSREVSHSDVGAHCPPNSSWNSTYVESTGATVSMKDAVPRLHLRDA